MLWFTTKGKNPLQAFFNFKKWCFILLWCKGVLTLPSDSALGDFKTCVKVLQMKEEIAAKEVLTCDYSAQVILAPWHRGGEFY